MSFDFPSSPTNGQSYTSGGKTFIFNGYAWDPQSSGNFVAKTGDTMTGELTVPALNLPDGSSFEYSFDGTYGYTIIQDPDGNTNIWLGDAADNAIYYTSPQHVFNPATGNAFQTIIDATGLSVQSPATPSTSPTTGALRVAGGVGIGGQLSLADTQPIVMGSGAQVYGQGATYIQRSDTFGWYNAAASVQFGTWTSGGLTIGSGAVYSPGFYCVPGPSIISGAMINQGGADGFLVLNDGSNRANVFLGGTAGTNANYFRNTTHAWQGIAGTPAFGQLDATGLQVSPTTASTTPTTGALKVSGGAGISGNLNTGGDIRSGPGKTIFAGTNNSMGLTQYLQSMYVGVAFGDAINIDGDAAYKWAVFSLDGNMPLIVQGKTGAQKVFPNSDNVVALGQPAQRWSHVYAAGGTISGTLNMPGDATGTLSFGSSSMLYGVSNTAMHRAASHSFLNYSAAVQYALIDSAGLSISPATASTSPTTGALKTVGGAGVALDVNAGGRVAGSGIVATGGVGVFGANNLVMDVSGGIGRLMSFGANASTRGALDIICYSSDASLSAAQFRCSGVGLGFYGAAPAAKPTVSGSLAGNAALTSLIAALAGMGLITNSTGP